MTQRSMIHSPEDTVRRPYFHSRNFFLATVVLLAAGLTATLFIVRSKVSSPSSSNSHEVAAVPGVQLEDALAMQYAQPWLDKQPAAAVPAVQLEDALAMQYAQAWLDKQPAVAVPAVRLEDALAMQYAQAWLDKQPASAVPAVRLEDALAMQYAQPWLEAHATDKASCHGSLELMYACQNGGWRP